MSNLKKIVAALMDTAKKDTYLDNIYSSQGKEGFSWKEVQEAYDSIPTRPDVPAKVYEVKVVVDATAIVYVAAKNTDEAHGKVTGGAYSKIDVKDTHKIKSIISIYEV